MSDEPHNSGSCCGGVPVVRVTLGALLLLAAVWFVWLKHRPEALGDGLRSDEQRAATLEKLHTKADTLAKTYTWLDKDKNVVRLPLDRAMELTVDELNAAKK